MFACSKTDYYFSLFTWNQKEERVYSELQSRGIRQSGPTSWMRKEKSYHATNVITISNMILFENILYVLFAAYGVYL